MKRVIYLFLVFMISNNVYTQSNYALQFNGSNQHITVGHSSALDIVNNGALTIEGWIYPTNLSGNIVTRDSYGYGLMLDDGKLLFWDQGSQAASIKSNGSITLNRWQHIAVTVVDNGSNLTLNFYINGVPDGGNPKSSTQAQINNSGGSLDFGVQARSTCNCNRFTGYMDEFRFWNVARTAQEIKDNYLVEISASSPGLFAYYKFNEGTGSTLTDATSNTLNGSFVNNPTWRASGANIAITHPGNSLNFTTSQGNYINVPHGSQIDFGTSTDFTIEAWIKLSSSVPNYTGIVAKATGGNWYGFQLVIVNDKIAAETRNQAAEIVGVGQGLIGTSLLTDGNWHHVALVVSRSTTTAKLYVDGTQEASVTNAAIGGNLSNSSPMYIGAERTPGNMFNGFIDEVRIWNVARNQAQLDGNKGSVIDPKQANLVAYYRFDQGISSGTNTGVDKILDLTSYSNDGTLTNFLLTGSNSNWTSSSYTPLPVELTSFNADIVGSKVKLSWQTATEQNNFGFEIERGALSVGGSEVSEWKTIGFVEGNGNSNSPKEYSFSDELSAIGKYSYRLKQIDTDGSYTFSDVVNIEIDANINPAEFALLQNYPNPFNPVTTINYSIPTGEYVSVKIYNTLGEEIATLFSGYVGAGKHSVLFDASKLSSGLYIYKLSAGSQTQVKKMILAK
ncbi:MAG: T9SS type A sorting domain-containing protein [Ignavibacteriaceae bacterium]|nr:T9SS type A sorting domain-containing protein [Ignavibacteriaceae bacterium]